MNIDEPTYAQLVGLTIAVSEGVKRAIEGLTNKELNPGIKLIVTVVIGTILGSAAEFAPEYWERFMPILIIGLVAGGLYSLGKRGGVALLSVLPPRSPSMTHVYGKMSFDDDDDNEGELEFDPSNLFIN